MLSDEQRQNFHEQGYVVLNRVVPETDLANIKDAAQRIVSKFDISKHRSVFSTKDRDQGRDNYFMDSANAVHCFLEEDAIDQAGNLIRPKHLAINKIGHAMHELVPEFIAFCNLPIFTDSLYDLGYDSPQLWQTMYIFKQPRIGGEVRWHQDASYLRTEPASVTGIWVAIEDAHRDNGCLWVQPGGQRSPLREVYEVDPLTRNGELRTLDTTPWPTAAEAVALEVPAGSVVIFADHLPHYSSTNRSDRSRQAFSMHFAERETHWLESNWLQKTRAPFVGRAL